MKSGAIDAREYILRKLPWDLSRPRFMDFLRGTIEDIALADTGFTSRLRAAAIQLLEEEEEADILQRGLTALAFVGNRSDIPLVERFCDHPESSLAKFARTCLFELKQNAKKA